MFDSHGVRVWWSLNHSCSLNFDCSVSTWGSRSSGRLLWQSRTMYSNLYYARTKISIWVIFSQEIRLLLQWVTTPSLEQKFVFQTWSEKPKVMQITRQSAFAYQIARILWQIHNITFIVIQKVSARKIFLYRMQLLWFLQHWKTSRVGSNTKKAFQTKYVSNFGV